MSLQTQTPTQAPLVSTAPTVEGTSLFFPAGAKDVRHSDLMRELLRWPMILSLPLSVAILTVIGMQSLVAMVPCGVVLATVAVVTAAHRACARVTSRNARAVVTALVPSPRSGHGR
ncbi:MAG TPA: hypothetical protein VHV76_08295 [Mycobacteriales bacterium]|jgi:hypothetical protein|nr:hypothetical protein [Mycobacteriales bacterium]